MKLNEQYIAIDIGGTSIKHGIISADGNVQQHGETASEARLGAARLMETVAIVIEGYLQGESFAGICISTAGVVDDVAGTIIHANENIPGYTGTDVKGYFEERFNLPTEVENDARCAGLSEACVGAAKNSRIAVCLTIGTGVGGAVVINKEVFHGAGNFAGEVGYMQLADGDFERSGSTTALIHTVANAKNVTPETLDGIKVFQMAADGDPDALQAIEQICDRIAYGIANICYLINPDIVVLGGGVVKQWDVLYPLIRQSLDQYLLPKISATLRIEPAQNGNLAGMLGAFWNFKNKQKIR